MRKILVLLLLALASTSVLAHGRARVHLGLHFGFPIYHPYWYYPPPVYYYPVPVAPPSPPVYVEREAPAQDWWYYCEQSRGYYPYVKECPGGWQRVPPAPPPAK